MFKFLLLSICLFPIMACASPPSPQVNHYHVQRGHRHSQGFYYYKGKDHHHFTYKKQERGVELYFCPSTRVWFYYHSRHNCYYPHYYRP